MRELPLYGAGSGWGAAFFEAAPDPIFRRQRPGEDGRLRLVIGHQVNVVALSQAFAPEPDGWLNRVLQESVGYAERLSDQLEDEVYDALEPLVSAVTARYAEQDADGHWLVRDAAALQKAILSINILDPAQGVGIFWWRRWRGLPLGCGAWDCALLIFRRMKMNWSAGSGRL